LSEFYYRRKAEIFLGVPPLFLSTHPFGNELLQQAWMVMGIDSLAETMARQIAKQRGE
jgi:hypothetical protein